jgi:hypothetical protein
VIGTLELASPPKLPPPILPNNSASRLTTQEGPAPNSYTKTQVYISDIRLILELQRQRRLKNIYAVLVKICKTAKKAIAQRLILANHNKELQETTIRKKARANKKRGNLSPKNTRVYNAKSLVERAH